MGRKSQAKTVEQEEVYEVEAILDHKKQGGKTQYLVKWLGYDRPEDNTWQGEADVEGAPEKLKAYWDSLKEKKTRKSIGTPKSTPKPTSKSAAKSTPKATPKATPKPTSKGRKSLDVSEKPKSKSKRAAEPEEEKPSRKSSRKSNGAEEEPKKKKTKTAPVELEVEAEVEEIEVETEEMEVEAEEVEAEAAEESVHEETTEDDPKESAESPATEVSSLEVDAERDPRLAKGAINLEKYKSHDDWENLIKGLQTLERDNDGQLRMLIIWTDESAVWADGDIVRYKAPQKIIDFYTNHLKFQPSRVDDDEEDD